MCEIGLTIGSSVIEQCSSNYPTPQSFFECDSKVTLRSDPNMFKLLFLLNMYS